jgi:hypothetical protein
MAPELIKLFLFPARFGPPLGDQFGNRITAFRCLSEPMPKAFKRSETGFHQQPIFLNADIEDVPLA